MGRDKFPKIIDPRLTTECWTHNEHPYTGYLELPKPKPAVNNHGDVVYYITSSRFLSYGSAIKIGLTNNLPRRMYQLSKNRRCLDPVVLGIESGNIESLRHTKFDASKISGEYFWPSIALVEHINECFEAAREHLPLPGVTYREFD